MASSAKRPWHMFYPLAGMILISIVWCGYWFVAFQATKELVAAKRLEFAGKGAQLTCAQENWGGFPFRFEFRCQDPSLHISAAGNNYRLKSAKLVVVAQAYNPLHNLLLVDGPTTLDLGMAGLQTVTHDQALISVKLNTTGEFDISSEAAKVDAPDLFSASQLRFFAKSTGTILDLAGNADGLVVQSPKNSSTSFSRIEFIVRTSAPLPGQPFEIKVLNISQGTVEFSAQGNIQLDPRHRLTGSLSSKTNDIDRLMKIISPILALNENDSITVKNLVRLTGTDPATKMTRAEFVAHDGALYWGPLKLADLEPLY